jgi:hypothetical protein
VDVGFLWYCWNSFLFIIVVLFGRVICSRIVMFNNSSWCRYLRFSFVVMVGWLVVFWNHILASGVSLCGNAILLVWMCAKPLCFSRYSVLAVGECEHASLLSNGKY